MTRIGSTQCLLHGGRWELSDTCTAWPAFCTVSSPNYFSPCGQWPPYPSKVCCTCTSGRPFSGEVSAGHSRDPEASVILRSLGAWMPCDQGAVDFVCPMVCLANRAIYPRPPRRHLPGWELWSGRQRTGLCLACTCPSGFPGVPTQRCWPRRGQRTGACACACGWVRAGGRGQGRGLSLRKRGGGGGGGPSRTSSPPSAGGRAATATATATGPHACAPRPGPARPGLGPRLRAPPAWPSRPGAEPGLRPGVAARAGGAGRGEGRPRPPSPVPRRPRRAAANWAETGPDCVRAGSAGVGGWKRRAARGPPRPAAAAGPPG
ncbi:unnamed protein product [Nyctereutes procyonoides]|uniref:(raccoon dog) hypothetical protein n=1 Tax=Nyctereutes procyonoides TaxID=34880 RepID=A0A811Y6R7_NYCPR|nr:unnamed protein product [Nyctereutes procyonoides]